MIVSRCSLLAHSLTVITNVSDLEKCYRHIASDIPVV